MYNEGKTMINSMKEGVLRLLMELPYIVHCFQGYSLLTGLQHI